MVLKYHISPYPTLMEDFLVRIWEAENDDPEAFVWEQTYPQDIGGGHNSVTTVIANGLDKKVHIVRLYAATSGNKLHEYNEEPTEEIINVFDPIRFKIGDGLPLTPLEGTNTYQNDLLIGLEANEYIIHRNNVGDLHPGVHYTPNPETGEFELLGDDEFHNDEEFTIKIQPKVVSTVVNDSVVGKWFGGFLNIGANISFEASHLRKLLRFTAGVEYTFDSNPPTGYGFCFQNFSGATAKINFENAPLKWVGGTKNDIDVPQRCEGCFVFDGEFWNVVYFTTSTFIEASGDPVVGQTLGIGSTLVGNPGLGDFNTLVTHNLNITGDYAVMLSIRGTQATWGRDNEFTAVWWHHTDGAQKPNKFWFSIEHFLSGGTRNVTVIWQIIKM